MKNNKFWAVVDEDGNILDDSIYRHKCAADYSQKYEYLTKCKVVPVEVREIKVKGK